MSFEPETAFSALSFLKDDASFLLASFLALIAVFAYPKHNAKKPPTRKEPNIKKKPKKRKVGQFFPKNMKKC